MAVICGHPLGLAQSQCGCMLARDGVQLGHFGDVVTSAAGWASAARVSETAWVSERGWLADAPTPEGLSSSRAMTRRPIDLAERPQSSYAIGPEFVVDHECLSGLSTPTRGTADARDLGYERRSLPCQHTSAYQPSEKESIRYKVATRLPFRPKQVPVYRSRFCGTP